MLKTADWFELSQMGCLLYLRMCHVPWQYEGATGSRLEMFEMHYHQLKAMAELTNLLDALLSPTLDRAQTAYITQQRNVAEWHFYKYMPREQHRLLAHALWHVAEQAVDYGPPTLYWLFPMERSLSTRSHRHTCAVNTLRTLTPRASHVCPCNRWLGYFVERARSPVHPEMSALNAILREMRCGARLPETLASAIFPSPASAHNAQYVDAPYTRPHDYTVHPFYLPMHSILRHAHKPVPVCVHCIQTAVLRGQLDRNDSLSYRPAVHRSFMRALRGHKPFSQASPFARDGGLLAVDNADWVDGLFEVDCLLEGSEVMRHRHEGMWTNHRGTQWRPQLTTTGTAAQQDYMFGIPCDAQAASMEGEGLGSGVAMSCSSSYHERPDGMVLPQEFRLVHHWPPIYDTEHMAYGFVHQWIRVRQGPLQAIIARVGILCSERSDLTMGRTWVRRFPAHEAPRLAQRVSHVPPEQRQDLFVSGHFIAQRITVAPLPLRNDAAWIVSPMR